MASFTDAGDTLVLDVKDSGEEIALAISGTYDMTILFQREVKRGSGAWETIKVYDTANATVAAIYTTINKAERVRFILAIDTSGTATVTLAEGIKYAREAIKDRIGNDLITFYDGAAVASRVPVVNASSGSFFLNRREHANRVLVLTTTASQNAKLPPATGSGDIYTVVCGVTKAAASSVLVNNSSAIGPTNNVIRGTAILFADGGDTVVAFGTASDTDTVYLFGTANSAGGIIGARAVFTDIQDGVWHVDYVSDAGGTEATPFDATVA